MSGDKNANAISKSIPAVVTKAQDVFVTFEINGTSYAIYDIRLRMLSPIELARAQGFPSDYILTGTQIQKIGRIGNSVCPPVAQALIAANTTRITVDQAA